MSACGNPDISSRSLPLPGKDAGAIEFVQIPEGTFWMGSRGGEAYPDEQPMHRVVITRPYWLAVYPITQRQFEAWTGTSEYERWLEGAIQREETETRHANHFSGRPDHPAECVTWWEAAAYCDWLNQWVSGWLAEEGWVATLPTEAQWEYAARAGTRWDYATGDGEGALNAAGWWAKNAQRETHPVGLKAKNPWGLYDLNGNVWEWTRDVWSEANYRKRSIIENPTVGEEEGDDAAKEQRFQDYRAYLKGIERLRELAIQDPKQDVDLRGLMQFLVRQFGHTGNDVVASYIRCLKRCFHETKVSNAEDEEISRLERDLNSLIPRESERFLRVIRGGSWNNPAAHCRSSYRGWNRPVIRSYARGFRVCLAPGSTAEPPPGAGGPASSTNSGAGAQRRADDAPAA